MNESFAVCEPAWAGLSLISFMTAQGLEHYGNLVTYMRLLKIVPPTAERAPAPAKAPAK